jgi:hypothetical protein
LLASGRAWERIWGRIEKNWGRNQRRGSIVRKVYKRIVYYNLIE